MTSDQIIAAWRTNNAATVFLVRNLPAAIWTENIPGIPRKTIGMIAAHLHNSRCMWIKSIGGAHGVSVPKRVDLRRAPQREVVQGLGRSSNGMIDLIDLAIANRDVVPAAFWQNFPTDLAHFLSYFAAHEGHHRGQLIMAVRQLGHRLPAAVVDGVWQWKKFAREAAR